MLKISAFFLVKQKSFIPKKDLGLYQYQDKKALFTDPIFSDGFVKILSNVAVVMPVHANLLNSVIQVKEYQAVFITKA